MNNEQTIEHFQSIADETKLPQTVIPDQDGFLTSFAMYEKTMGPWGKAPVLTILPKEYFS